MTRQRDLEFSELVARRCPLMEEAIRLVGHRQTRNRGTLGGSLCHLDPAAELVSVAAALDATVIAAGPHGQREIAFAEFPVAYMTPAIEPNELLTAVRLPIWPKDHGFAFIEFARRHGDFAIVSAAALLLEDGTGRISRARVIIGGMGMLPIRAAELEQALIGHAPDDKVLREACETCGKLDAIDDVHAPAAYRQHLATVLSRRALEQASARLPSRAAAARAQ
jgi:carbon-monoxide dehydrogenase medium subunit